VSVQYQAIGWNRQKRIYDGILAGSVILYLAAFIGVGLIVHPNATAETLLIRGFGTAAFLLLHVILGIGPLCRLNRHFLPLLYNRRHLGVTMFLLALVHGVNPVHTLPAASGFAQALGKVRMVVSTASMPDETSALAHLVLPDHTTA